MEQIGGLRFEHPALLLALPAVPLLLLLAARARLRAMPRLQRSAALALRIAIIWLLLAALAVPFLASNHIERSVVFVLDQSASMSQAQQAAARAWVTQASALLGPDGHTAIVAFGRQAQLAGPDGAALGPLDGSATNLADALDMAQAIQPAAPGQPRDLVLLSDGWENVGQAENALQPGTVANYVALPPAQPEVAAVSFDVPPSVRAGDALDLSLTVRSSAAMGAELRLTVDGQPAATEPVKLAAGVNRMTLSPRLRGLGFHDLRVEVAPERDTRADNNSLSGVTVVKDAGRVLLLEGQPGDGAGLATILANDGLQVSTRPAGSIPPSADALDDFDGAVLIDTPATSLTLDQQKTLQLFVQQLGRGLLVVGGPHSYGTGGYTGTVLDQILPVSSQPPPRPKRPSVALFLVVDKSGSMSTSTEPDEPTKVAMAREAAARAIAMLQPGDTVGVIAFESTYQWVVPPTQLASQADIERAEASVAGIESGGGTSILPPLSAAYQAAAQASAAVKQIVLLTDGESDETGYEALTGQMQADQITLSTVAIGSDADTNLLSRLADLGGGRYYFTARATAIPEFAAKETAILTNMAKVEGTVSAQPKDASPLLRDLSGDFPTLQGYEATTPRARAVTALVTAAGDPLLAHWQYGLGRVVAWTSGAAGDDWADAWSAADWASASRFWPQLVRWTLPGPDSPDFHVSAQLAPDGRLVTLRAESTNPDGTFADLLDTRATIRLPDGTAREVSLPQVAPGSYQTTLALDRPGAYHVLFEQREGGQLSRQATAGFAVESPGPEGRTVGLNEPLLSLLAERGGGHELRQPADLPPSLSSSAVEQRLPLWPWLLGLALLLLPLDVAARRLSWRRPFRRPADIQPPLAEDEEPAGERTAAD